jgi:thiamine-phosphate pyrophosphorylase
VVEHISIPFVAIGGIKLHNVDQEIQAGARRICVVSGIVGADNVKEAARAFAKKLADRSVNKE